MEFPIELTAEEFTQAWLWMLHARGGQIPLDQVLTLLPMALAECESIRARAELDGLAPEEFTRAWAWTLAGLPAAADDETVLAALAFKVGECRRLRDALAGGLDVAPGFRLQRLHSLSGEAFVLDWDAAAGTPSPPGNLLPFRKP